jgi:hypothetical protein
VQASRVHADRLVLGIEPEAESTSWIRVHAARLHVPIVDNLSALCVSAAARYRAL